jgi:hypothetical protein
MQKYVGIELRSAHVELLQTRYPNHDFFCRDLDRDLLDLGSRRFGTLVHLAVIEHLIRPKWLLSQLAAYMEPCALLLITTPSTFGDKVLRLGVRCSLFHPDGIEQHQAVYDEKQYRLMPSTEPQVPVWHKSALYLWQARG